MTHSIKKHLTKINKGTKGSNIPEWIVIHFVGASGQAQANANYFHTTYRGSSAHYFVDPKEIIQVVEDDTPAWHIGDGSRTKVGTHNGYVKKGGATNTNSIGIEGCQDTSTGKDVWTWQFHPETVNKIEWLVRELQKKYNIDDAHVIRHFDATGKMCPGNWKWNNWDGWFEFKKRLEKDIIQPKPVSAPKDDGKNKDTHMYLIQPGDTLSDIAKKHNVTLQQLVDWNDLENPNLIFPETKLFIKGPNDDKLTVGNNIEKIARDVIAGKYGNGDDRKTKLGDKYNEVQSMINSILLGTQEPVVKSQVAPKPSTKPAPKSIDKLAREVIDGKHGSGEDRKKSLGSQYKEVQDRVNTILGVKSNSTGKSLDELVDEVLRGVHGSGRERMISLGNRYSEVQREVNRRSK